MIPKKSFPVLAWVGFTCNSASAQMPLTHYERLALINEPTARIGAYYLGSGYLSPAVGKPLAPEPTEKQKQIERTKQADARNKAALVGVEARIVAFLRKRVADGSADAAVDLGDRYAVGKDVPKDVAEACKFYHLAILRGRTDATNKITKIVMVANRDQ